MAFFILIKLFSWRKTGTVMRFYYLVFFSVITQLSQRVSTLLGSSSGGKMVLLLYYFEIVGLKVLDAEDTTLAVGVALTRG